MLWLQRVWWEDLPVAVKREFKNVDVYNTRTLGGHLKKRKNTRLAFFVPNMEVCPDTGQGAQDEHWRPEAGGLIQRPETGRWSLEAKS